MALTGISARAGLTAPRRLAQRALEELFFCGLQKEDTSYKAALVASLN